MSEICNVAWQVLENPDRVADTAAQVIAAAAGRALFARAEFKIVLAGGNTPALTYRRLQRIDTDWLRWEVFFGDERCLAPEDPARNSALATQMFGERVPHMRIHAIPAERGAESAATEYAELVRQKSPFDLVVLGIGEDGHTASLFPGQIFDDAAWCIAIHQAPKPPAERVSLGLRGLRASREMLVIATGASKRAALGRWRAGEVLPITAVTRGLAVTALVDAAAWPGG
jgi:6-phosphogluconolactonase